MPTIRLEEKTPKTAKWGEAREQTKKDPKRESATSAGDFTRGQEALRGGEITRENRAKEGAEKIAYF